MLKHVREGLSFYRDQKIGVFLKKIKLWINRIKNYMFCMFTNFFNVTQENILKKKTKLMKCIPTVIVDHLIKLKETFCKYFDPSKDIRENNTRAVFNLMKIFRHQQNEEQLTELSLDLMLQVMFKKNKHASQFWIKVQNDHPSLTEEALKTFISFSIISLFQFYLCDTGFSTTTAMKNQSILDFSKNDENCSTTTEPLINVYLLY